MKPIVQTPWDITIQIPLFNASFHCIFFALALEQGFLEFLLAIHDEKKGVENTYTVCLKSNAK